jgi:iron(III) transport system substrate-binding protein
MRPAPNPESLTRISQGAQTNQMRRFTVIAAAIVAATLALTACTPPAGSPPNPTQPASITVYSGRTEPLVGPVIERFSQQTGIEVSVRYADTAELAALLLEEGENSPADVYFAQDAGALGAVADAGLVSQLPSELLERVPAALRSPAGEWVGISGRARVAVYDTRDVDPAELPQTIDGFTDPAWRGRIGWAPTNGSFQAFVTAYRQLRGDEAARAWLEGILANEPRPYEGNTPIVQAVADDEIDIGLVNHYYLLRALAEQGEQFPVRNHFFSGNDPGALINVAGAAILASSDKQDAALRFVEYLLAEEQQRYFATETFEYPLVAGVEAPEGTPPLEQLQAPDLDLSDLADLQGTLRLLQEVGVRP